MLPSSSSTSNLGRLATTAVELALFEVQSKREALPWDWARAFGVALAFPRAESGCCFWQRSDVDDELSPLVATGLEDGPPGSAFPNRHHDGGQGLLFGCLLEDP